MMRARICVMSMLATFAAVASGCVNTPQTKALITPVGAIGLYSFAPENKAKPSASDIDRMTANMKKESSAKAN